jgi:26S proteasome regulatory subunit (ATPase 3-interacting protein)
MNRPYGAVDVAANLKGAVPKATAQKILIALAEKGELVQKTYGQYLSHVQPHICAS